ncbi:MAG: aminopeptidase [Pseudomonadota bacterium]
MRPTKLLALALFFFIAGCASPSYYLQAVGGQLELIQRSESIDDVIARSDTEAPLKAKLIRLREIREFASSELNLPNNGSYRKYVDLKRPYVVWNVFATEELSVKSKEWCLLVVGCISYRGYFSKEAAESYAAELSAQGYDVYIGGVPAYSTLGYLDDPVLSTFIQYPEAELARLIFHELAHQKVFVKDDSTFNESFAAAVEQEGVKRWIAAHGKPSDQQTFMALETRRNDYLQLITKYRDKLNSLYSSSRNTEEKRVGKKIVFQEMKEDYQQLKTEWGGYSGYDWIFNRNLNNAFIVSTALYSQLVPAFQNLIAHNHGDMPQFYAAARALAEQAKEKRNTALAALMPGGGGSTTAVAAPAR